MSSPDDAGPSQAPAQASRPSWHHRLLRSNWALPLIGLQVSNLANLVVATQRDRIPEPAQHTISSIAWLVMVVAVLIGALRGLHTLPATPRWATVLSNLGTLLLAATFALLDVPGVFALDLWIWGFYVGGGIAVVGLVGRMWQPTRHAIREEFDHPRPPYEY